MTTAGVLSEKSTGTRIVCMQPPGRFDLLSSLPREAPKCGHRISERGIGSIIARRFVGRSNRRRKMIKTWRVCVSVAVCLLMSRSLREEVAPEKEKPATLHLGDAAPPLAIGKWLKGEAVPS